MNQWIIWLIIIVILTFLELSTAGLTTIWFVISALSALIVSLFIDNYLIQFSVFVILGITLSAIAKPILQRKLKHYLESKNKSL